MLPSPSSQTAGCMKRILIVDDHPLVRTGFSQLIAAEPDLDVCGEAADETEAVPVATWGTVKVQAAASTLSVGNLVACSTDGYAAAPTTDAPAVGICKYGSSGSAGRILSVQLTGFGGVN